MCLITHNYGTQLVILIVICSAHKKPLTTLLMLLFCYTRHSTLLCECLLMIATGR